ncbi:MAG: hypothetical protein WCO96_03840 [Actinomycetes bacterium]
MPIAMSPAWAYSIALIVTFGGIGVLVNLLLVYIGVQINAEREENRVIERDHVTG